MNTSGKGAAYERAWIHELEDVQDYLFANRTAKSGGPFDVHAVRSDGRCEHWQCKDDEHVTCHVASVILSTLEPYAWLCHVGVVHKTKEREFCEH